MLHRLQEGVSFGDGVEYTAEEYQHVSSIRTKQWKDRYYPESDLLGRLSEAETDENIRAKRFLPANLERDYWEVVETHTKQVSVEYGNDVDTSVFGSGFPLSERGRSVNGTIDVEKLDLPEPEFGSPDFYKESYWNLNNIPFAPHSALRHVKVGINGINVPWLYFGSLFTTFCWHNEDNYLYSINYHHRGAPKQWYGVPGSKEAADGLEKVFKSYLSMKMRNAPDLLHHITTMFSPRLLQNANVPVYSCLQHEGEFVVTFPRAFHGGFSYGPNIGEAVNFATHDWIHYGSDANERYRSFARPAVFSHDRLTFTLANHLPEQKIHSYCKLLLEELERVTEEELRLRRELLRSGVRDVSNAINLPPNRLDQLDDRSAAYDDKRLCHQCKHICFFSAVACECSQSKVSCLRHSHFMCRCPPNKRYFMIWSTQQELEETLKRVREQCELLASSHRENIMSSTNITADVAPGVEEDKWVHKLDEICVESVLSDAYKPSPSLTRDRAMPKAPSSDSDTGAITVEKKTIKKDQEEAEDEENEVEILEVRKVEPPM